MKGYIFVYGVDGFGADVSPAFEESVYLNKEKAWNRFKELTKESMATNDYVFYEDGYAEDYYPDYEKELKEAEQKGDWDLFDKLMEKHILTDLDAICKSLYDDYEYPPDGFYQLVEIDIIE